MRFTAILFVFLLSSITCTLSDQPIFHFQINPMIWTCKKFEDLGVQELYSILQLRNQVFIVEQNCPYPDCDNKDLKSWHLMGIENGKLLAYSRLIPAGISYRETSIGRVVNSPAARGKGLGKELMQKSIQHIHELFQTETIRIGAQLYLQQFYSSFGFVKTGEIYMEDNIPHIEMLINPK